MRCLNENVQVTSECVGPCDIAVSCAHIRRWQYDSLSDSWFHFLKKLIKLKLYTQQQVHAI